MESIFHEKQEGSLCAQHCLNALLQGEYFTPIDLAELAQRLDESEREHMAEAGRMSREYQQFIQQPSSNYDDSGFFSIQVLQQALSVWNLTLEPLSSSRPECQHIRLNPCLGQAFVCNFREHWLTIRQIGAQWFNLNSLLTGPELLSDTHLSLFLTQLQHEGYSIFVVLGELPPCEASDLLRISPAVQRIKPALLGERAKPGPGRAPVPSTGDSSDPDLQRALEESRRLDEEEDETLKRALQQSLMEYDSTTFPDDFESPLVPPFSHQVLPPIPTSNPSPSPGLDAEEIRRRRLAVLDKASPAGGSEAGRRSPVVPLHAVGATPTPGEERGVGGGSNEGLTWPPLSGSEVVVGLRSETELKEGKRREGEAREEKGRGGGEEKVGGGGEEEVGERREGEKEDREEGGRPHDAK